MNATMRNVAWNICIATAILAFGKAGQQLALPPGYASAIWPPAGVAFAAALILGGRQVWPGILIGSVLVMGSLGERFDFGWLPWVIAAGSTAQALIGEKLLRWVDPKLELDRASTVARSSLAVVAVCLIAALVGHLALYFRGMIGAGLFVQGFLTWWWGDALGVLIFLPLLLVIFDRRPVWQGRRLRVALPLLLAFLLCGLAYYSVRGRDELQLRSRFESESYRALTEMRQLEQVHIHSLLGLAALFESSEEVSANEFSTFGQLMMQRSPVFRTWEWAPLVAKGDEASYVRMTRQLLQQSITIKRFAGASPVLADWMVPVTLIEPYVLNQAVIGLDLNSETLRAEAIGRAWKSRRPALSNKIQLLQDPEGPGGVLAIVPEQSAQGVVRGFCIGLIDFRRMTAVLGAEPHLYWRLRDGGRAGALLSANGDFTEPEFSGATALDRSGVYYQESFRIADRDWHVVLHRRYADFQTLPGNSLLVLFLALTACGVLANMVLLVSGERRRVTQEVERKTQALSAEIEQRTQAESMLALHKMQLEGVVAERTAELVNAEAQVRLILDSSGAGMFGVDADGRFVFANPATCEMLGYTVDALIGQYVHPMIHHRHPDGSHFPSTECSLLAALRYGKILRNQRETFCRADGSFLPVAFACQPMIRCGEVIGSVVSFMDVTAQARAEAEQEGARLEAERLARVRGEFLANMSHEIRTPLNGVLGLAQIGYRDSVKEKGLQATFGRILTSGKMLLGIINDILDFSKIEAGKLQVEQVPLSPRQLVDEVVELLAERAQLKGIELKVNQDIALPQQCLGDPVRTAQILTNLLSNAIKFTEAGCVTFDAGVEGQFLRFQIKDTGIGLSEEQIGRLFTPFEQGDGSTTRKFGGTGLGLAITHQLVELMGGRLLVESCLGEGSCFEVLLPFSPLSVASVGALLLPVSVNSEPRLIGVRVLAAEDNEVNRLVLEDILVTEGASIVLVENGLLAVERFAKDGRAAYDVVLMDVQMPEMDGYEATRQILALAPDIPVIGQTAHALPEERQRCLQAGMRTQVIKPLDGERLVAVILQYLEGLPLAPPVVSVHHPQMDWAALQVRYAHKPNFLQKLLIVTRQSQVTMPAQLRAAIVAADFSQLLHLTHCVKGMAGNLLAQPLVECAKTAEMAARTEDPAAWAMAERVAIDLEALLIEINTHIST